MYITEKNKLAHSAVVNFQVLIVWNSISKKFMKKYPVSSAANWLEYYAWRDMFIKPIPPMIRKNTNVKFAAKVFLWKKISLNTTTFILEKNLSNVNFAQLVLRAEEHMQHIKEVILAIVVIILRNRCCCIKNDSDLKIYD